MYIRCSFTRLVKSCQDTDGGHRLLFLLLLLKSRTSGVQFISACGNFYLKDTKSCSPSFSGIQIHISRLNTCIFTDSVSKWEFQQDEFNPNKFHNLERVQCLNFTCRSFKLKATEVLHTYFSEYASPFILQALSFSFSVCLSPVFWFCRSVLLSVCTSFFCLCFVF